MSCKQGLFDKGRFAQQVSHLATVCFWRCLKGQMGQGNWCDRILHREEIFTCTPIHAVIAVSIPAASIRAIYYRNRSPRGQNPVSNQTVSGVLSSSLETPSLHKLFNSKVCIPYVSGFKFPQKLVNKSLYLKKTINLLSKDYATAGSLLFPLWLQYLGFETRFQWKLLSVWTP